MTKAVTLALVAALSFVSTAASAEMFKKGKVAISDTTMRLNITNRPGAGFMLVHNMGNTPDRIISASTIKAKRAELHTHTMTDGVMRMRPVKGVDIPANDHVAFESGGYHIMLFGLSKDVKVGGKIPITINFKNAGALEITASVVSLTSKKMPMKMKMKHN